MKINCPNCQAEIPVENINISEKIAKCSACNSVVNVAEQINNLVQKTRAAMEMPRHISVAEEMYDLVIKRRWLGPLIYVLSVFTIFWNGIILFFISGMLEGEAAEFLPFLSIHILTGVGLLYFTVAGYLNNTLIRVNSETLTVVHKPLPWWGNRQLISAEIRQLYAKKVVSSSRGSQSVSYEVHVLTGQGKDLKLLSGIPNPEQALFIEQQIEKFLKIQDKSVDGEIPR